MDTIIEFRIPKARFERMLASFEQLANFKEKEGGDLVTLQFLNSEEAARRFHTSYSQLFGESPSFPYLKWKYTDDELEQAKILHLFVWSLVEMAGREYGTVYEESTACLACGTGATQAGDLVLDLARMPDQDVVMTLAGEHLVSPRFHDIVTRNGLTGLMFGVVRGHRTGRISRRWKQLHATSSVRLSPKTLFGIDPFDLDPEGRYRCERCELRGARRVSENFVSRDAWSHSDFATSRERVGTRMGLYAPWPLFFISPRAYRILKANKLTGFGFEVAHLA